MVWARRIAEGAADDPVGAGRNSVGAREPGPNEQVADPGPGASGRERVAVEQDDPARFELMPQRDADGNRGAERVADDNRPPEPEVPGERADEAHPLAQRVRAVSLAVAEGREVDREDAVRATEARARLLPNEARHDEAAEQDDRAAAISPVPIGDELSVQANERPRIERGRRLHSSGGGRVVSHGRERHHDEQLEQDDAEPLRPASEAARHPPTLPANHVSEAPSPSPRSAPRPAPGAARGSRADGPRPANDRRSARSRRT